MSSWYRRIRQKPGVALILTAARGHASRLHCTFTAPDIQVVAFGLLPNTIENLANAAGSMVRPILQRCPYPCDMAPPRHIGFLRPCSQS